MRLQQNQQHLEAKQKRAYSYHFQLSSLYTIYFHVRWCKLSTLVSRRDDVSKKFSHTVY